MKCFLCKKYFSSDKEIIKHLKIAHNIKNGTTELKCVVSSKCKKTFTTFIPFQSHIKKCDLDPHETIEAVHEELVTSLQQLDISVHVSTSFPLIVSMNVYLFFK